MLNHTPEEALLLVKYVQNYLDSIDNLPDDVARHLSRMQELDINYQGKTLRLN